MCPISCYGDLDISLRPINNDEQFKYLMMTKRFPYLLLCLSAKQETGHNAFSILLIFTATLHVYFCMHLNFTGSL